MNSPPRKRLKIAQCPNIWSFVCAFRLLHFVWRRKVRAKKLRKSHVPVPLPPIKERCAGIYCIDNRFVRYIPNNTNPLRYVCVICDTRIDKKHVYCGKHKHLCHGILGVCPDGAFVHDNYWKRCTSCTREYMARYGKHIPWNCYGCSTPNLYISDFKFTTKTCRPLRQCIKCMRKRNADYRKTLSGFITNKVKDCQYTTARRNKIGRNHDFDITPKGMVELAQVQNFKCAISDMHLSFSAFSMWQASIDRIDDKIGYLSTNVRWVCLEFNNFSKWNRAKFDYAFRQDPLTYKSPDVETIILSITNKNRWKCEKGSKRPLEIKLCQETGQELYECRKCQNFLRRENFAKHINKGCRKCSSKYASKQRSDPRSIVQTMVSHAHSHSEERKRKNSYRDNDHPCTLTFEDVVDMYKEQKGRCAYSDIPLCFDRNLDWCVSLERLDTVKNYSRENVALICSEFQASDHSVRRSEKTPVLGWSRDKVLQIRQMCNKSK